MTAAVNPEQLAAIEEEGVVFVSAGAGTGKTRVLVERYVRAVADRGLSVDSVLVITYTERAAGELRDRIRSSLVELGRGELARDMDRAWISTIHGFCSRLLRTYPFEAGIDPRFRVLDEGQASVLQSEAFAAALASFCSGRDPARLALLASYGARSLRTMLTGVLDRLRSAGLPLELRVEPGVDVAERLADLRAAADAARATEPDPDVAAAIEALVESATSAASPLELWQLDAPPGVPSELADAVGALQEAALEELARRDRDLLEALLRDFDAAYRQAKSRESAVDFEDLQLHARELLLRDERVRTEMRLRFRSILVDEFQDTNRLQCEIIDQIAGGDLFFVGDEFQSIYRFRHADVDVFRERRSATGGVLALTVNYRSRPEVLAVVNHLFSAEFGGDFEPLRPAGRFPGRQFGSAVELLVTDKASCRDVGVDWREAEARHVAARVRELVDEGECTPGDVVLLFQAGTRADAYEAALRAEGLPTYRATGRGYFGQQQVVDVLSYLRLIQNRYDDEALLAVLASPLVGVSSDALALVRRAAQRQPVFRGIEHRVPEGLSERDRRLVAAFRQRYERLVRVAAAADLEQLCERILVEHDYDLAVLAHWDGRRRYANLRKLARLAGSYQEIRGADLEGFIRFVRDQESLGVREGEGIAEEEGAEAVRLLTIHGAKGLEFKVVVVCDAGRLGSRAQPDEVVCLPDGRFGFRVADPVTGKRLAVLGWDEVRESDRAAEEDETRRLYYVAMTRAIDRLLVAGSIDPTRRDVARSTVGWVLERLGTGLPGPSEGPVEVPCGDSVVLVRANRPLAHPSPPATVAEQLQLFGDGGAAVVEPAFSLPELVPLAEPPPWSIARLSYSALAVYRRCPYRFYAERIVGLSPDDLARRGEPSEGLHATEIGDAVHVLLETGLDGDAADELLASRYPGATEPDRDRIAGLVEAWRTSATAEQLAALEGVSRELPFAYEHDGVLIHGFFDVHHERDGDVHVVDYKTNRLGDESPAAVVDRDYALQRLVYALCALRAGARSVEVAFVFLERAEAPVVTTFSAADTEALAAELSGAIAAIREGEFRPTPSEHACAGCPALDRVCAGPRLLADPWGESDPEGWVGAEPDA